MPAINVAKTDTFESQRVKINQIATAIFNVTAGGSDLSTGILKLGDGTKPLPSLAFSNEPSLGFYRPASKTISFVSGSKNILDIEETQFTLYKDEIVRKRSIPLSGGIDLTRGSGYEFGTYPLVPLNGGSGANGVGTFFVDYFRGTAGTGSGYAAGTFTGVPLQGGSGSDAAVDFTVTGLEVALTDAGTNYVDGFYSGVAATNVSGSGNGSGATLIVEITASSVTNISVLSNGNNQYEAGDVITVADSLLGSGGGSGLEVTVNANAGVLSFDSITKAAGYTAGNVLTLPVSAVASNVNIGGTHISAGCSLTSGSTTVTLGASTNEVIPGMVLAVDQGGSVGGFPGGSTVTVVSITNGTTVEVDVAANATGAADITFASTAPTIVTIPGGTANLVVGQVLSGSNTTVADGLEIINIIDANDIELDGPATAPYYQANLTFTPKWGVGTSAFTYTIDVVGAVETLTITDGGTGYVVGDELTVASTDLINPIEYSVKSEAVQHLTFTGTVASSVFTVGDEWEIDGGGEGGASFAVGFVKSTGGNVDYVLLLGASFSDGDLIRKVGTTTTYTINVARSPEGKFYISPAVGSYTYAPDLTFYVGERYRFNLDASMTSHEIKFSKFPDGKWQEVGPVATTVAANNDTINVTSTASISVGMAVEETGNDPGQLAEGTVVTEIINATQVRVSPAPTTTGTISIKFNGVEYTDGITVTGTYVEIKVTDTTPSTLYYYCENHPNMGGEDGDEAVVTVDPTNPRVFGSGFLGELTDVTVADVIKLDIETGKITCLDLQSPAAQFTNATVATTLNASNISGDAISLSTITASAALDVSVGTSINLTGDVTLGTVATVAKTSGNIATPGEIKTTTLFNSNDALKIEDATLESINNYDLEMTPFAGRLAKVNTNTAFVLPVGTSAERPTGLAADGSIRFNSDTNQYEGYSTSSASWSSLGGVRDLDGNTYILAELTVGANDNTLHFVNDSTVTQRFTPSWHEYVNVKQVRSVNITAPAYTEFVANQPVSEGDYVKWRNNIYVVPNGGQGTTATSGSEPTHTTGTQPNGTAQLEWFASAVAPLTFEEIEEVRISPLGSTPLVISGDLRLLGNTISTDVSDLVIQPNSGKRVDINCNTTLSVPVGGDADRGSAIQGGIRFSTTSSQFEGYDGANWGSLGGVKDVDQNTYIIPETTPGANENILYFYNDGNNTAQLTTTALDFYAVDTIRSMTSDELEVTSSLITFDSAATTLDNTTATTTFLHSAKQYFDLGLSSGLYVEPVLRLDNQGDVYFNTTFGTGSFTGVKVFDGDLTEFELADTTTRTTDLTLIKGTTNTGGVIIYDPAVEVGSKSVVTVHNPTSGEKEYIEFGVIDNGTDVFHTEYGNVRTGQQLIIPTFEVTGDNKVKINFELGAGIGSTQSVNITLTSQITKK